MPLRFAEFLDSALVSTYYSQITGNCSPVKKPSSTIKNWGVTETKRFIRTSTILLVYNECIIFWMVVVTTSENTWNMMVKKVQKCHPKVAFFFFFTRKFQFLAFTDFKNFGTKMKMKNVRSTLVLLFVFTRQTHLRAQIFDLFLEHDLYKF